MSLSLGAYINYHMAQNFGSKNLWQIAPNKHFGGQNIAVLAVLQSKIAG